MAKYLPSQLNRTFSSTTVENEAIPSISLSILRCVEDKLMFLDWLGKTLKSGSVKDVNSKLNALRPSKPERTMNRAAVPKIMPNPATRVM